MKKNLIFLMGLLLMTFLSPPRVQAETAEIGGDSQTNNLPINAAYGDYGAHGQMIYPQATLENAGLTDYSNYILHSE